MPAGTFVNGTKKRKTLERRKSFCRKCNAHGTKILLRGHAPVCPYNFCKCIQCDKIFGQRIISFVQRNKYIIEAKRKHGFDHRVQVTTKSVLNSCNGDDDDKQANLESVHVESAIQSKPEGIVMQLNPIQIELEATMTPNQIYRNRTGSSYLSLEHFLASNISCTVTPAILLNSLEEHFFGLQIQFEFAPSNTVFRNWLSVTIKNASAIWREFKPNLPFYCQ
ncbi:DM DNA binding domain-containing protein [Ditylenchus destructor]|uniref:DM DNA binding domain-containing protein n=1 Tax=Ditylenchus destructor TaxID=166010 RepID=A0AAD4R2I5_9BILA|nr:DM DNA binding domain-containing protein [Ditylenchus destructor]